MYILSKHVDEIFLNFNLILEWCWKKTKDGDPFTLIFHKWNKNCFIFIFVISNRISFKWKIYFSSLEPKGQNMKSTLVHPFPRGDKASLCKWSSTMIFSKGRSTMTYYEWKFNDNCKYYFLHNHHANFNWTWQKASLGEGNSRLIKERTIPFPKRET